MGQYFIYVNPDKREFIQPDGGNNLWELCADISNAGILPYLLADGEKDGTPLLDGTRSEEKRDEMLKSDWRVFQEDEFDGRKFWVMEKETRFFGHWSGDRIVVAGDYGHTKLYDLIMREQEPGWTDITKEAYEEFYEFLGFKPKNHPINPDMVITAEGAFKNPRIF